jgi:hypothetical protein
VGVIFRPHPRWAYLSDTSVENAVDFARLRIRGSTSWPGACTHRAQVVDPFFLIAAPTGRPITTESATHLDRSDTPAMPGMHAMPDHVAAAIVIVGIVVIGIVVIAVVGVWIA